MAAGAKSARRRCKSLDIITIADAVEVWYTRHDTGRCAMMPYLSVKVNIHSNCEYAAAGAEAQQPKKKTMYCEKCSAAPTKSTFAK